jgi:2-dehydro-3-deoxygalactonokinase
VVLDWGTSRFRAALVQPDGGVVDRIETGDGIQGLQREDFAGVLARALAPWGGHAPFAIVGAGMVTSRNGWVEVPYVACPADARAIAAGAQRIPLEGAGAVLLVPGLIDRAATPYPDVLRGEETQLVGLGLERDATVVLPGTHCKWARIERGAIRRFQTFVTGEVFALLAQHSFIARMAAPAPAADWAAFERGVAIAAADDARSPGLLARLFAVRTGWLDGAVAPREVGDILSGIVVGSEFAEARAAGWLAGAPRLVLIGGEELATRYVRAARAFGLAAEAGPADASILGALVISGIVA